jgi:hypothetical protein
VEKKCQVDEQNSHPKISPPSKRGERWNFKSGGVMDTMYVSSVNSHVDSLIPNETALYIGDLRR